MVADLKKKASKKDLTVISSGKKINHQNFIKIDNDQQNPHLSKKKLYCLIILGL
jgi:hypothetical protein